MPRRGGVVTSSGAERPERHRLAARRRQRTLAYHAEHVRARPERHHEGILDLELAELLEERRREDVVVRAGDLRAHEQAVLHEPACVFLLDELVGPCGAAEPRGERLLQDVVQVGREKLHPLAGQLLEASDGVQVSPVADLSATSGSSQPANWKSFRWGLVGVGEDGSLDGFEEGAVAERDAVPNRGLAVSAERVSAKQDLRRPVANRARP